MTMPQAITSVFSKYAVFRGRAGGTEFWWFALFQIIVLVIARLVDQYVLGGIQALLWICELALLLPAVAVAVRRLHDTNRSGWWYLLALIPVADIVLLIWFCTPSNSGPNRFGEMPGAISLDGVAVW
jgi:uncharacterized membrane protein YhaH (DUF805 family)